MAGRGGGQGFTPGQLQAQLRQLPDAIGRYVVAYSGGRDSHCLLWALSQLADRPPVAALHVDHGLHPDSAAWASHCQAVGQAWGIPCRILTLKAHPPSGESPEAAARRARYRALAVELAVGDALLTAHHQDDQAETVLLQLLRGAGPRGLAGMPAWHPMGQGLLARPLLAFSRGQLDAYARAEGLSWLEDPSNLDIAFDRNYLRHQVLPVITERWPAANTTLARAAEHQGEVAELLAELAAADWEHAGGPRADTLRVSRLAGLSPSRGRNLVRYWLRQLGLPVPNQRRLDQVLSQIMGAGKDRTPHIHWSGTEVRRYRGLLYARPTQAPPDTTRRYTWDLRNTLALADGTELRAQSATGQGLRVDPRTTPVTVGYRQGGERCQLAGGRRQLKKLLQEQGIPPWERDRLPLIYIHGQLAAVADLWICEPFRVADAELGWTIQWLREDVAVEVSSNPQVPMSQWLMAMDKLSRDR